MQLVHRQQSDSTATAYTKGLCSKLLLISIVTESCQEAISNNDTHALQTFMPQALPVP